MIYAKNWCIIVLTIKITDNRSVHRMNDFGNYLKELRLKYGFSSRALAKEIGVSAVYYCNVENGKQTGFAAEKMEKIAEALHLSEDEKYRLYDLSAAGRERKETIPADCVQYLLENKYIIEIIRKSQSAQATERDWAVLNRYLDEMGKLTKKREGEQQ